MKKTFLVIMMLMLLFLVSISFAIVNIELPVVQQAPSAPAPVNGWGATYTPTPAPNNTVNAEDVSDLLDTGPSEEEESHVITVPPSQPLSQNTTTFAIPHALPQTGVGY